MSTWTKKIVFEERNFKNKHYFHWLRKLKKFESKDYYISSFKRKKRTHLWKISISITAISLYKKKNETNSDKNILLLKGKSCSKIRQNVVRFRFHQWFNPWHKSLDSSPYAGPKRPSATFAPGYKTNNFVLGTQNRAFNRSDDRRSGISLTSRLTSGFVATNNKKLFWDIFMFSRDNTIIHKPEMKEF